MKLAYSALLVPNYDAAIAFYCGVMGFELVEDNDLGGGKRWVVIGGAGGGSLLLALAKTPDEIDAIGSQFGGRVPKRLGLQPDQPTRSFPPNIAGAGGRTPTTATPGEATIRG